jgi:tetratricopeptide (TPR) repeat protein
LDEEFAMAYAMLAWTHAFDAMNGWSDARKSSLRHAIGLATRALEIDEAMPVAHYVRGISYWELREPEKALIEVEKAVGYDPNHAGAHVLEAMLLYYHGRPEEGLAKIEKAIRLNPQHPYNYKFHLGQAYYVLGRYSEAISTFRAAMSTNPSAERCHVWLAAALGQSEEFDEAASEIDKVLRSNPTLSRARIKEMFPFNDPADFERFLEGLRKAGLSVSETDLQDSW